MLSAMNEDDLFDHLTSFVSLNDANKTPLPPSHTPTDKHALTSTILNIITKFNNPAQQSPSLSPQSSSSSSSPNSTKITEWDLTSKALQVAKILLREKDGSCDGLRSVDVCRVYMTLTETNVESEGKEREGWCVRLDALKALINAIASTPSLKETFITSLNALHFLSNLLKSAVPVEFMHQVVRLVHLFVATVPAFINHFLSFNNNGEGMLETLITLLCYTIHNNEPQAFPRGRFRVELANEIVKALYAIGNFNPKILNNITDNNNNHALAQLGIVLIDIINLPNTQYKVYKIKLDVVKVLLFMEEAYGRLVVCNFGVERLIEILTIQATSISLEKVPSSKAVTELIPILAVLNNLLLTNPTARLKIKESIFPSSIDKENIKKGKDVNAPPSKDQMAPLDAPVYTLRANLISLMTNTDTNVKRYSSEMLWNVCDGDAGVFSNRVGFGSGVHFLGIKGLVDVPKE